VPELRGDAATPAAHDSSTKTLLKRIAGLKAPR
jgi:hypothetical protein